MILLILQKAFDILFQVLEISILIDVILSWVPIQENTFTRLIHTIAEPFFYPGRIIQEKFMPGLAIDFSPVLALIILAILKRIVFSLIAILFMHGMGCYLN
ncbi:YggT family protein [Clostridium botulinum]|uniref:Yggt family protein n=1 Tax=Clostridium botulinum D str. 1873 TaxID=592027 RepID=A0A9P2G7V4_CLOBO|nr:MULTISPECIES: YggT family protein [Clostridium]AYF54968.1 YggT family protein [Clostridium novyi]EES91637.1 yggt family protein [Clostridium botulinum D str. 1873]MBO3441937.1 YggT family protein [Clostridium haemolyticum]MCD3215935.1 YggT family protein [Clostridium botulinum C]MCD3244403.1 YggT family protein [Clostridium botulinum C]